jgi:hypothetical protein
MLASIYNCSCDRDLTIEGQLRVGGNAGKGLLSVGESSGDNDSALSSNLHALKTDIPSLDDLTLSKTEGEGLSLGVGVEDLSVLQLSDVAHTELSTVLGDRTVSDLLVLDGDTLDNLLGGGSGGGLLSLLLGLLLSLGFGLGSSVLLAVSRALLDRVGKLDLLLGLGSFSGLNGLSAVCLQLLLLLLGELGLFGLGYDGVSNR